MLICDLVTIPSHGNKYSGKKCHLHGKEYTVVTAIHDTTVVAIVSCGHHRTVNTSANQFIDTRHAFDSRQDTGDPRMLPKVCHNNSSSSRGGTEEGSYRD